MSDWIPLYKSYPQKNGSYICIVDGIKEPVLRKYLDGDFFYNKTKTDRVTHWMELPKPPGKRN